MYEQSKNLSTAAGENGIGTLAALSVDERNLLRKALASHARESDHAAAMALSRKIAGAAPHPDITIGVHGGLVQWTLGNPFPIRICDYDGADADVPDMDERGQRCAMWFEPSDRERDSCQISAIGTHN